MKRPYSDITNYVPICAVNSEYTSSKYDEGTTYVSVSCVSVYSRMP